MPLRPFFCSARSSSGCKNTIPPSWETVSVLYSCFRARRGRVAAGDDTWQGDDPETDDNLGVRKGYADASARLLLARATATVPRACEVLVAHLRLGESFKTRKIIAAAVEPQGAHNTGESGRDHRGRPVLVFDVTRVSFEEPDTQLRHLVHHVQRVERKPRHRSDGAAAPWPSRRRCNSPRLHLGNFSV